VEAAASADSFATSKRDLFSAVQKGEFMRRYMIGYSVVVSVMVLSLSSFSAADHTEYMYCRAHALVTVHPNYYSDVFSFRWRSSGGNNVKKSWDQYLIKEQGFKDENGLWKDFHDSQAEELYSTRCYSSYTSEQEATGARAQAMKEDREKFRRPPSVETGWTYSADDDQ